MFKLKYLCNFLLILLSFVIVSGCSEDQRIVVLDLVLEIPAGENLDQEKVRQAYRESVKEFGRELLAKQDVQVKDGKTPLIGIIPDSNGIVVNAFKHRNYSVLNGFCEKNECTVIFFTTVLPTEDDLFFSVESHFFARQSGGVYHFKPYLNVNADVLSSPYFWKYKWWEMYRKLTGEK